MNRTQEHPMNAEIKTACSRCEQAYKELDQLFPEYISDIPSLDRKVKEAVKKSKIFAPAPERYANMRIQSYLFALIAEESSRLDAFYKRYGQQLTSEGAELVGHLRDEPMFWSLFRIEASYDQAVFDVIDLLTGRKMLLKSPALEKMQRETRTRNATYHCFLFSNGICMQTAGLLLHSRSCLAEDFSFALTLLNPEMHYATGPADMQQALMNAYMPFHLIDRLAEMPVISTRGIALRYHWSIHRLPTELAELLSDSADFVQDVTAGSFTSWVLVEGSSRVEKSARKAVPYHAPSIADDQLKPPAVMLEPRCIIDKKSGKLLIDSFTQAGYELIRKEVESLVSLDQADLFMRAFKPEIPESMCRYNDADSVGIHIRNLYQKELPHVVAPFEHFTLPIEKEESKPTSSSETDISSYNEVLKSLSQAHNMGYDAELKKVARESGLSEEIVQSLQKMFKKTTEGQKAPEEVTELIRQYPLERLEQIPPVIRSQMSCFLDESELIGIVGLDGSAESLQILGYARTLGRSSFADLLLEGTDMAIEELFIDYFGNEDTALLVMNMLIYELLTYQDEWVEVRALIAVILNTFHHLLLPVFGDSQNCIEAISILIAGVLCPVGLCEVKARPKREQRRIGAYEIRTTLLFDKLFYFVQS